MLGLVHLPLTKGTYVDVLNLPLSTLLLKDHLLGNLEVGGSMLTSPSVSYTLVVDGHNATPCLSTVLFETLPEIVKQLYIFPI